MSNSSPPNPRIPRSGRKLIRLSSDDLVRTELPSPGDGLPVALHPGVNGVDLISWAERNRLRIEALLTEYGAILFRDFTMTGVSAFERLIEAVSGGLLEYTYRSTPRRSVSSRIYTST